MDAVQIFLVVTFLLLWKKGETKPNIIVSDGWVKVSQPAKKNRRCVVRREE
jgi:hypothetical protein